MLTAAAECRLGSSLLLRFCLCETAQMDATGGGAVGVLAGSRQPIDRIHDIVDHALRTRWTVCPYRRPDRENLE